MKVLLLILFLFISIFVYSQSFGVVFTSGIYTKKDVTREMDREIRRGIKNKVISSSSNTIVGDTLIYIVNNNVDGFKIKYTFNSLENEEAYCDFEQYLFDCSPCSQKHFKEFINLCHFRKKSESTYISNYFYKTELTVSNQSENKGCLILSFKFLDIRKREHRNMYKKLPESTTLN
jgi:hypothetical protein